MGRGLDGALELVKKMNWSDEKYQKTRDVLKRILPQLGEGKEGFAPPV